MIESISWLQSVNFFMIGKLIRYGCSQIFELFHTFKGFITFLYIVILSCVLVSKTWSTNEAKLNLMHSKIPVLHMYTYSNLKVLYIVRPLCECKIFFQYMIGKFNICGQTAGDSVKSLCILTQWTPISSRKLSVATVMWATNSKRTNSLLSENNQNWALRSACISLLCYI